MNVMFAVLCVSRGGLLHPPRGRKRNSFFSRDDNLDRILMDIHEGISQPDDKVFAEGMLALTTAERKELVPSPLEDAVT